MASSFIHPLDQNPSSPSSKQRRRNAALSCAECRRYSRFLHCPVNWLIIPANKAQVEVRTSALFRFYYKTELASHRCSRVFPCASCVKKGCAAICPKGMHECTMCILVSYSRANSGSLTTGKGNRCAFFSLLCRENFQANTSTIAPQLHSREHRSAS
jgi:hypothetical protein